MDGRRSPARIYATLLVVLLAGCSRGANENEAESSAPPSRWQPAARAPEGPPRVRLATTLGEIVLELDREHAPLSVDNFLQYVDQGHYDGTIFHQVVDGYVALGGAFTPELTERPSHTPVRNEAHNGLKNVRGTIAMARDLSSIDSSTCQFFVNLQDNPSLDHRSRTADEYGYCVFGRVVEGMDVIDRLAKVETRDTESFELIPVSPVVIRTARRELGEETRQAAAPSDSRTR